MNSIEELICDLGDKSKRIREKAERELVKIGEPAVESLIHALENDSFAVRCRAASALGKIKDTRAIEPLIQRFTDEQQVQIKAAVALGRIGKPAIKPLIQVLEVYNHEIREGAVMALGEIGDPEAVGPLLNSLKDGCSTVRWRAATALRKIADERSIQPLIHALSDQDFLVRWHASSSLGKIGKAAVDPLLQALQNTSYETKYGAACALESVLVLKTVDPFIHLLKDEHPEIRCKATSILGNLGRITCATRPLIKALKDNDKRVRLHAAEALGNLGDLSAIGPLFNATNDHEYAVREAVAISLTKLRDTVGPVLRTMNLRSGEIHNGVIRTRERKRFSGFFEVLAWALRESEQATRMASALALGVIGGPRPIEPLGQALNDEKDEDVRLAVVDSLGTIGRTEAIKFLKQALNDESPRIRRKALGALTFLRDISAVEPLLRLLRSENSEVRWSAAEDLGRLGGGNQTAEKIIREELSNVEDNIKKEAVHALETMTEEKGRKALYVEIWEA